MATEIQRERLRGDLDADDDALTDAEIDDAFARAEEQYGDNAAAVEAAARVVTIQQLLAGAAKRADYTQNESSERRSQVFDHLMRLRAIYEGGLAGGAGIGCAVRRAAAQADADRGVSRCLISRRGAASEPARALEAWPRIGDAAGDDHDPARGGDAGRADGADRDGRQRARGFGFAARAERLPGVQRAVVFGVREHPTVADTDIQRGDRFVMGATEFEVIGVIEAPGEVQAICEART